MENLSIQASPLQEPTKQSPRVLILGGGVIALTTAWTLLDRGIKVTIVSKDWAIADGTAHISSQAAGALWKCLPLECGPQAVTAKLAENQKWSLESYKVYNSLASMPECQGIFELRPCTIVTTGQIDGNKVMSNKLEFVQKHLAGYRRSKDLFDEYDINTNHAGGLVEAYEYTAPIINVDRALEYLSSLVVSKGATLKTATITGNLVSQESELLTTYNADVIINAMGLNAGIVAGDKNSYGLHGALLRLVNDGSDFPIIRNTLIVSSTRSGESSSEGAFILPRDDGVLALGTISTPEGVAEDLTLDSVAVKEMRARCEELLPQLKNARLVADAPLIFGTRPQRRGGARVEREKEGSRIVHTYGHGGAGWSLAMGSAQETAKLVDEIVAEVVQEAELESCIEQTMVQEKGTYPMMEVRPTEVQNLV